MSVCMYTVYRVGLTYINIYIYIYTHINTYINNIHYKCGNSVKLKQGTVCIKKKKCMK